LDNMCVDRGFFRWLPFDRKSHKDIVMDFLEPTLIVRIEDK
jgi:hypothetical protein